ncbi:MAG: hypothetical protein HQ572_04620 [Candidatus Omnitrophica bacterium]|nr:hypothetical protein [Candidatus Omnitrophota bacterium]
MYKLSLPKIISVILCLSLIYQPSWAGQPPADTLRPVAHSESAGAGELEALLQGEKGLTIGQIFEARAAAYREALGRFCKIEKPSKQALAELIRFRDHVIAASSRRELTTDDIDSLNEDALIYVLATGHIVTVSYFLERRIDTKRQGRSLQRAEVFELLYNDKGQLFVLEASKDPSLPDRASSAGKLTRPEEIEKRSEWLSDESRRDLRANTTGKPIGTAFLGLVCADKIHTTKVLPKWLEKFRGSLALVGNIVRSIDPDGSKVSSYLSQLPTSIQRMFSNLKALMSGGPANSSARVCAQLSRPNNGGKTKVTLVSAVGRDGRPFLKAHNKLGIDTSGVSVIKEEDTAYTLIFEESDGTRTFVHMPMEALTFDKIKQHPEYFENKAVIELGGLELTGLMKDLPAILTWLKRINPEAKIIFDTVVDQPRQWKKFREIYGDSYLNVILDGIDLFAPSEEALQIMADYYFPDDEERANEEAKKYTPEQVRDFLIEQGARAVVLKWGKSGAYVKTTKDSMFGVESEFRVPIFKGFTSVGATGTGDAFCAGLVYAVAHGWGLQKTVLFASAVGGMCVQYDGGTIGDEMLVDALYYMERIKAQMAAEAILNAQTEKAAKSLVARLRRNGDMRFSGLVEIEIFNLLRMRAFPHMPALEPWEVDDSIIGQNVFDSFWLTLEDSGIGREWIERFAQQDVASVYRPKKLRDAKGAFPLRRLFSVYASIEPEKPAEPAIRPYSRATLKALLTKIRRDHVSNINHARLVASLVDLSTKDLAKDILIEVRPFWPSPIMMETIRQACNLMASDAMPYIPAIPLNQIGLTNARGGFEIARSGVMGKFLRVGQFSADIAADENTDSGHKINIAVNLPRQFSPRREHATTRTIVCTGGSAILCADNLNVARRPARHNPKSVPAELRASFKKSKKAAGLRSHPDNRIIHVVPGVEVKIPASARYMLFAGDDGFSALELTRADTAVAASSAGQITTKDVAAKYIAWQKAQSGKTAPPVRKRGRSSRHKAKGQESHANRLHVELMTTAAQFVRTREFRDLPVVTNREQVDGNTFIVAGLSVPGHGYRVMRGPLDERSDSDLKAYQYRLMGKAKDLLKASSAGQQAIAKAVVDAFVNAIRRGTPSAELEYLLKGISNVNLLRRAWRKLVSIYTRDRYVLINRTESTDRRLAKLHPDLSDVERLIGERVRKLQSEPEAKAGIEAVPFGGFAPFIIDTRPLSENGKLLAELDEVVKMIQSGDDIARRIVKGSFEYITPTPWATAVGEAWTVLIRYRGQLRPVLMLFDLGRLKKIGVLVNEPFSYRHHLGEMGSRNPARPYFKQYIEQTEKNIARASSAGGVEQLLAGIEENPALAFSNANRMKLTAVRDYDAMSRLVAYKVLIDYRKAIAEKDYYVLGLPTGSTPIGLYGILVRFAESGLMDFKKIITFNMDEYEGLDPEYVGNMTPENPGNPDISYKAFMYHHLFKPLFDRGLILQEDINRNVNIFESNPQDAGRMCAEYERRMDTVGGVDTFIGGIGPDGHIAFNEPDGFVIREGRNAAVSSGTTPECESRRVFLTQETVDANVDFFEFYGRDPKNGRRLVKQEGGRLIFVEQGTRGAREITHEEALSKVPRSAFSIGIMTYKRARHQIVMANGENKASPVAKGMEDKPDNNLALSLFHVCPNCELIITTDAASQLTNPPVIKEVAPLEPLIRASSAGTVSLPVLVLNSGSSSVKYQVIDMSTEEVLIKDVVENIGEDGGVADHNIAIANILQRLKEEGIEPVAVGHRVVHGGEIFSASKLVDDEGRVEGGIEEYQKLAPLHNQHNLAGIRACKELLPGIPQVVVFDTAFHQTIPEAEFRYAIPEELYEKHKIRRYGFHGTSHFFVALKAIAKLIKLGIPRHKTKVITCHLGNGASIAAVKGGKSIATSMGLTPLEGLVMGTRTGDIDPAAVLYIMKMCNITPEELHKMIEKIGLYDESGLSQRARELFSAAIHARRPDRKEAAEAALNKFLLEAFNDFTRLVINNIYAQLNTLLNKKSGMLGVSGVSNDVRVLIAAADKGNKMARLALEIYKARILHYIYAYDGKLGDGGADAIVFTAGVGAPTIKNPKTGRVNILHNKVCDSLIGRLRRNFGNRAKKPPHIFRIPTDEEYVIASETMRVAQEEGVLKIAASSAGQFKIEEEEVVLPSNPYRNGKITFAAVDAIRGLIEPKNIERPDMVTAEIEQAIRGLAQGLVDIAKAYAEQHSRVPTMAVLSYNTLNPEKPGQRNNVNIYIVDRAIEMARELSTEIDFYGAGSVQADTALVRDIAIKKAGGAQHVRGEPDIFVFPSFHSYDIALGMLNGISQFEKSAVERSGLDHTTAGYYPRDPVLGELWKEASNKPWQELPIIVLPEGNNDDIRKAGKIAHMQGLARITFLSDDASVDSDLLQEHLKRGEMPPTIKGRLRALLAGGAVDGMVAGIDNPTSHIIRDAAAIKAKRILRYGGDRTKGVSGVYDYFIMRFPYKDFAGDSPAMFVNTASLPMPNVGEVVEMASMAASDFEAITKAAPRVALLCGTGETQEKAMEALATMMETNPGIDIRACDFQTALKDGCNIFVFPDLVTGNVCYKLAERVLGAEAWGPFIMAQADKPLEISDLSRGVSWEDILNTIVILSARISGRTVTRASSAGTMKWSSAGIEPAEARARSIGISAETAQLINSAA